MPVTTNAADPRVDAQAAGSGGLAPELQKALGRLTEISSLPEITTRIVQVVEDPKSTAQDMHDIVKHDPALAAKILKVVNSAFYGLPAQIASLDRAIVMLGLSAVKNIALAASLSRMFRPGAISERFGAKDLWHHCIAVGVCARLLADSSGGHSEEAFVAGLVHDLGLLVEYQLFPEQLKSVVEHCEHSPKDFCAVERECIGADHTMFGGALATKWKFPPGLRNAIAYHHNPSPLKPEFKRIVTAVHVADTICCQNQIGFYLTAQSQEVSDAALEIIGINADKVAALMEILPTRIEETTQILSD
ncbi:MAG: HDOD domain-containing protein [Phycisphaerae bacterium]